MVVGIPILFFVLLYIQGKVYKRDSCNVPVFFTIYWGLLCFFGLLFYQNTHIFSIAGFCWILMCCVVLFLFDYIAIRFFEKKKMEVHDQKQTNITIVFYIVLFCFVIRIVGCFIFLSANQIGLLDFFNGNFQDNIELLTQIRYNLIPSTMPSVTSWGNTLSYLGALLLGYYYHRFSGKSKKILITAFILSTLFYFFVSLGKATIIYSIIVFLSSYLTEYTYDDLKVIFNKNNRKKFLKKALIAIIVLLLLIIFMICIRDKNSDNIVSNLTDYAFGEIPAFDFYFNNMRPSDLSFGKYTFYGIWSKIFGADPLLTQGIYPLTDVGGVTTNVFTAFRSIIDDFGIYFGLAFFGLLGIISSISRYMIKYQKLLFIFVPIYSFLICFVLESYVISVGNFFSITFAYFLFALILFFNTHFSARKEKNKIQENDGDQNEYS